MTFPPNHQGGSESRRGEIHPVVLGGTGLVPQPDHGRHQPAAAPHGGGHLRRVSLHLRQQAQDANSSQSAQGVNSTCIFGPILASGYGPISVLTQKNWLS